MIFALLRLSCANVDKQIMSHSYYFDSDKLSIIKVIAFFVHPDRDSKIRKYWNWCHRWVGRLALFLASVNIVLGIQVGGAGPSWKVGYGINLAIILLTAMVLEVVSWARWSEKSVAAPAF